MRVTVLAGARCAAAGFLTVAGAAAFANSYTIVDLGPRLTPRAVNDKGAVLAQGDRAKVYRNGRWHSLPANSVGYAMDAHGDVAGGDDTTNLPILFPRDGAPVDLVLPAGGLGGYAQGLNDKGQVVGYYWGSSGLNHCFSWTAPSGSVDMGLMGEGDQCDAYAVNASGQVTGQATIVPDEPFAFRAFIWRDGRFKDLGTLPGDIRAVGVAINDAGHVVGYGDFHAFLWNGRMVDLDKRSQFDVSSAASINSNDEIVGTGSVHGDSFAVRFADGRVITLLSEVPDPGKWTALQQAYSINDQGVIVGYGIRSGRYRAFMLVPQAATTSRR
jgi:probable HAF family extracellular repeat protein